MLEEHQASGSFFNTGWFAGSMKLFGGMPTERKAREYNMKHENRGQALIFNNEHFKMKSLKPRFGSEEDCKQLCSSLQKLKFNVQLYKDKKVEEIQTIVKGAAQADHTNSDCILIAIMSHGVKGYLYAQDGPYKLDTLVKYLTAENCKTLAGKPKLFFIQACQGHQRDSGVAFESTEACDDELLMNFKIPVHADFLFAYSTIPGFVSYRTIQGSWFIKSLCKELNENGQVYDVLTLLTFVCQRVAFDFETYDIENPIRHQKKQIPCTTTMLTRILRFTN